MFSLFKTYLETRSEQKGKELEGKQKIDLQAKKFKFKGNQKQFVFNAELEDLAGKIGGRVGLVVRALAFHQCGPRSMSAPGVICGLSLLLLYSAMRGFPPGTPVFPSHQKPTFDLI